MPCVPVISSLVRLLYLRVMRWTRKLMSSRARLSMLQILPKERIHGRYPQPTAENSTRGFDVHGDAKPDDYISSQLHASTEPVLTGSRIELVTPPSDNPASCEPWFGCLSEPKRQNTRSFDDLRACGRSCATIYPV